MLAIQPLSKNVIDGLERFLITGEPAPSSKYLERYVQNANAYKSANAFGLVKQPDLIASVLNDIIKTFTGVDAKIIGNSSGFMPTNSQVIQAIYTGTGTDNVDKIIFDRRVTSKKASDEITLVPKTGDIIADGGKGLDKFDVLTNYNGQTEIIGGLGVDKVSLYSAYGNPNEPVPIINIKEIEILNLTSVLSPVIVKMIGAPLDIKIVGNNPLVNIQNLNGSRITQE